MIAVNLNLRLKEGQDDYVPLDVNISDKLELLRTEAAKHSNVDASEISMIYCGALLRDSETVSDAGLASGDCVHCLRSKAARIDEAIPLTTLEVHELHRDLSRLMRSKKRHAFFAHLQQPQKGAVFWKNALSSVAGAWRDPDAALPLQDYQLLYNYSKDTPSNLGEVTAARPVLGRLLQHMMEVYKKEWPWPALSSVPAPATAFSLDVLYEPDEEDPYMRGRSSESSADGSGAGGSSSDAAGPSYASSSLPAITPAQLAAALANATGTGSSRGPPQLPNLQPPHRGGHPSIPATPSNTPASASATPASHTSHTPSSASTPASHTPASASGSTPHQLMEAGGGGQSLPHITSEMLNTALQSVLGVSSGGGTSPNTSSPRPSSTTPSSSATPGLPNLEESVRLMQEMGIPDEALSRQALLMTNGDVQAAVQLVFAQLNMFD